MCAAGMKYSVTLTAVKYIYFYQVLQGDIFALWNKKLLY